MAGVLHVARASRPSVESLFYVEVELENGSTSMIGAGGLRLRAEPSYADALYLTAANQWPIAPGGRVYLTAILPKVSLKRIDFVAYIEADGTVHPLRATLTIGWMSCELKQDTIGGDVQA